MKYGNAFTKGHINVCPAKVIICNICNDEGHFGRLCKLKGRRPVVNKVEEIEYNQSCSYSPEHPQILTDENFCGVINAWTEEETSDNDDYSVLNIKTIYNTDSLETKKHVSIGLGEDAIVNKNSPMDSANPVNFLKQNVLHELKLRNPKLKIHPFDMKICELNFGCTIDTINNIGKVVVRNQCNEWKKFHFFLLLNMRGIF